MNSNGYVTVDNGNAGFCDNNGWVSDNNSDRDASIHSINICNSNGWVGPFPLSLPQGSLRGNRSASSRSVTAL